MYKLVLLPEAEKFYRKAHSHNKPLFDRLNNALSLIRSDPFAGKPLKDRLRGKYSFRVGDYRIIYSFEKRIVTIFILDIAHRREVYR